MKLGKQIMKILNRTYEADAMIEKQMGRYDLQFKTDAIGRPVLLFLGEFNEQGMIKGDRFVRRIVTDAEGKVIKDHWDNKGAA
ncbi:hypothetical protein LLH06_15935 [Mucilaginibacter daejeonensis]|uniref:hypothetical protein n=1 Tax=Mucilaginibacter daejeonensis TaxID=398049 RepID=UPI001D17AC50|nr:hypothetical protein [Mucilaginibacter daejeonensis]UEG52449.1 hypothetical protein LLH06_15935 [Mucilaginibacter daejeonensis]